VEGYVTSVDGWSGVPKLPNRSLRFKPEIDKDVFAPANDGDPGAAQVQPVCDQEGLKGRIVHSRDMIRQ